MPVAMNIGKLYQSQEERVQDEMNQAKADALRRNVLGGTMQSMIKHGGQTANPAAGNPFGKLFGGLGKGTPAGVPAHGDNPLGKMFGGLGKGGPAGLSQSMAQGDPTNPFAKMFGGLGHQAQEQAANPLASMMSKTLSSAHGPKPPQKNQNPFA